MRVVAHAVRSGIAALNVVTAALETDARTRAVDLVFARGRDEVARAISRDMPTVVAWSFYSPDVSPPIARLVEELAARNPPVHGTRRKPWQQAPGRSSSRGVADDRHPARFVGSPLVRFCLTR